MQLNLWKDVRIRWAGGGIVGVIIAIWTFRYLVLSWPIPVIFRDSIRISEGSSAYHVAKQLKEDGFIPNESLFVNAVRLMGGTRSIRAGNFQIFNARHIGDLAKQILRPRPVEFTITLPEGLTREQIAQFIALKYPIDTSRYLALTGSREFLEKIGLDIPSLEGYLFPNTYRIQNGSTEEKIIEMMVRHTQQALSDEIIQQGKRLGLDEHEILTMASIIEGEAQIDTERTIISAVYHNRLRRGMRLQADPTVQYAIPGEPRRLLYRDYEYPSEYNTYLHKGLPPGPVNNPGIASIRAAVSPAEVDYLYFVAEGQGRHIFTNTLEEHNRVVQQLRQRD
ncbi:endolytic transglycosylase MltG [Candidatus Neomarinimicrobiota bacterium]